VARDDLLEPLREVLAEAVEVLRRNVRAELPDVSLPVGERLALDRCGRPGGLLQPGERVGGELDPGTARFSETRGHQVFDDGAQLVDLDFETPKRHERITARSQRLELAAVQGRRGEDKIVQHITQTLTAAIERAVLREPARTFV
jgi:hypothetical protein